MAKTKKKGGLDDGDYRHEIRGYATLTKGQRAKVDAVLKHLIANRTDGKSTADDAMQAFFGNEGRQEPEPKGKPDAEERA